MIAYGLFQFVTLWQWLFLLALPLFVKNLILAFKNNEPHLLYPQLKNLAMATFVMVLLFGVGLLI